MNYFLKKKKWMAWVVLLTFLFTSFMPSNLLAGNSVAEAKPGGSGSTTYAEGDTPSDGQFIRVSKTFAGLTKDKIPTDFAVTVTKSDGQEIAKLKLDNKNLVSSDDENNKYTYVWTIPDAAVGTYTVSESGENVDDYVCTPAGTGTVMVEPSQIEIEELSRITQNSQTTIDLNTLDKEGNMVIATLTSEGIFVWSKVALSSAQQQALIEAAGTTEKPNYFYHGSDRKFTFKGAEIEVDSEKNQIHFGAKHLWKHVIVGRCEIEETTAEIAITNTYVPKTEDIMVSKVWVDNEDTYKTRPESIQLRLYANGQPTDNVIALPVEAPDGGDAWSKTVKVPKVNPETGDEIVYTVKEIGANGEALEEGRSFSVANSTDSYTVSYTGASGLQVTNTLTGNTSISGSKTWNDNNNQDGVRPESIKINLYADEKQYIDSRTVTEADNWSWTFENLDKYADGRKIVYTITEDPVADYTTEVNGYDVTNTHTPETVNKTVTKVWEDSDNQDGIRPTSITVQLKANGNAYGEAVILRAGEDGIWQEEELQHTWSNLPKKANGADIVYTVEETSRATGYTTTYSTIADTFTITNKHIPETVSKTVTKVWEDSDNQDGIRPTSITVQLKANGNAYGEAVILRAGEDGIWQEEELQHTWSNLPKKANGADIVYTVEETSRATGYTTTYSTIADTFTITNKHIPETVSKTVTKVWEDSDNQDGIRPTSITVQLKANGNAYGEAVILRAGEDGIWQEEELQHTWSNLPKKANGADIVYTVEETSRATGYTTTYSTIADTFTITNKHIPETVSKTVTKVWEDSDNQDGIRPTSITVQLKANGNAYGEAVILRAGEDGIWQEEELQHTWSNLPKKANGVDIVYTVEETSRATGYTTTYSTIADTFTITNKHIPETVSKTVTKVWEDSDNQDGIRPTSITVQLKANGNAYGEAVILRAGEDGIWQEEELQHTWSNLPKKANGADIVYTVEETSRATGYTTTYSTIADTFTITNKHIPETVSKTVTKVWEDSDNQDGIRPTSITVQLKANGNAYGEAVILRAGEDGIWQEEELQHTWSNLPKKANGADIVYTVEETSRATGYTTTYSTIADTFTITNKHIPETVSKTVTKVWEDSDNQDGIRPTSITVQLKANGNAYGEAVILRAGEDGIWQEEELQHTWSNLPKKANGADIVYTVEETSRATGYTTTYSTIADTFTITNKHIPETVSKTVTKVWEDSDNQDGIRPTSITVQLKANGNAYGEAVILRAGEDGIWQEEELQHTWSNLPKKANGADIVYTVEETSRATGYTTTYSTIADTFTITNKHIPETVSKTVTKVWEDSDNQDGIRPTSITVQLKANGNAYGEAVILRAGEDGIWQEEELQHTWSNLPKKANGVDIVYTVEETSRATGYTTTYSTIADTFTITNKHIPETVSKTVTKVWEDSDNQDGIRPTSITVQLKANGNAYGEAVILRAGEDGIWQEEELQHTWSNLPKKANGADIVYTVEETSRATGYTTTYSTVADTFTITNKHIPDKTEIAGSKIWVDNENQDGKRPTSITVNLLADGNEFSCKTVTAADNWSWTFDNLDKYANGKEITYTIAEDAVEGYISGVNGYNITNTIAQANVTVTGKKTWQNAEGTALPEKITVELFRDGESYATTETALDWTYSFGELPKYAVGNAVAEGEKADGHLYEYTVKEATALQEFTAYYDRTIDADGNVVINITNVKDVALIPISGTKSWFDNLPDQNHPQVTIVLYQEDAAGTVTAIDRATLSAQSWDYDFGYRPKYDENGNPYRYFVKEVDVPAGYVSVVSGYNVNNVLMALYEMGNISVTKNVVNSPETSNSFDFTLYVKALHKIEGVLDSSQQRLKTLLATAKGVAEGKVKDTEQKEQNAIEEFSVFTAVTSGSSYQFMATKEDGAVMGITTGSALYVENEVINYTPDSSWSGLEDAKKQIVGVINRLAEEFVHAVAVAKDTVEDVIALALEEPEQEPAAERPTTAVMLKEIANEVEVTTGSAIAFSESELNSMFDAMVAHKQALVEYNNVLDAWKTFESQVTTTSAIVLIVNGDMDHPISLDPASGEKNETTGLIEFTVQGVNDKDGAAKVGVKVYYNEETGEYQIPFTLLKDGTINFSLQATTGSAVQYRIAENNTVTTDGKYVQTFIYNGNDLENALQTKLKLNTDWADLTSGSAIGYVFRNEYKANTTPTTPGTDPTDPVDPIVPEVPIDDPDVPLAEPDVTDVTEPTEPDIEIDDPDVPLSDVPGEPVEIEDPQVPLSDAPQTGDTNNAIPFVVLMMVAGLGLVITRKRFN